MKYGRKSMDAKQTAIQLNPAQLRKLQMEMLDLLVEFDRICRKHNIRYFYLGGHYSVQYDIKDSFHGMMMLMLNYYEKIIKSFVRFVRMKFFRKSFSFRLMKMMNITIGFMERCG